MGLSYFSPFMVFIVVFVLFVGLLVVLRYLLANIGVNASKIQSEAYRAFASQLASNQAEQQNSLQTVLKELSHINVKLTKVEQTLKQVE